MRNENGSKVFDGNALTKLAFGLGPRGCFGIFGAASAPYACVACP